MIINTPVLSWVIPVYNGAQYIGQAIESILRQPCQDFEILVVDDGSTDSTASVVQSYLSDRVRMIRKENGGVSTARNLGIDEARGQYIAFLDADDVICRNAYTDDLHDVLTSCTYDLLSFPYYSADQNLRNGLQQYANCNSPDTGASLDPFKHCSSFIYLHSLLTGDQAPCFPEGIKIREDVTFQFLVNRLAKQVKYIDQNWFLYRNNVSSVLHTNIGYEYIVRDVIPAWQWCKGRCDDPESQQQCRVRIFAETLAYIRMSCMSGKSLSHIKHVLELPAVQDALSHYDSLWRSTRLEYESFLANPRKYWIRHRLCGIAAGSMQCIFRIPILRKAYMKMKYTESLESLR